MGGACLNSLYSHGRVSREPVCCLWLWGCSFVRSFVCFWVGMGSVCFCFVLVMLGGGGGVVGGRVSNHFRNRSLLFLLLLIQFRLLQI